MRETRADTAQALLLALLLHALLFGLVLFGLWWTREPETVSAAGSPVQAELVDANALPASMQRAFLSSPAASPIRFGKRRPARVSGSSTRGAA